MRPLDVISIPRRSLCACELDGESRHGRLGRRARHGEAYAPFVDVCDLLVRFREFSTTDQVLTGDNVAPEVSVPEARPVDIVLQSSWSAK